eukprot:TRINITY_DN9839_c0_g1_i1.p2 TRINITY_DN9839_c0_g1~~TRINITY_DN9839_c0_g1_i1.p2  ORF type:complete len:176 (+),score=63.18 TRINITY_DN9839_c0_g1_i1:236-763(+)
MDALLVLEDFQVLASGEDGRGGPSEGGAVSTVSAYSPMALGLLLHQVERFPGVCILVANIAMGSSIRRLDPELLRRLKFLVEFKVPDQAVRAAMWKKMLPAKAPLAKDVSCEALGKRFEFTSGAISSAIVRAAAKAALRRKGEDEIGQKDLLEAAEVERSHMKDEIEEVVMRAFI